VIEGASGALGIAPPRIESTTPVDDIDWVSRSQAQFTPIRISARLCIAPSWHADDVQADVVVRLDPGAAFGTGAHPTTQLCLAWLDRHLRPGASVLDVGCGSGILAIAAAKLGAGRVVGTDIDPQALAIARANTAENAAAASYTDPDSLGAATFDIVLANILANPLKLLAPALLARVAPRGTLVLSGVLERQAPDLIDAYHAVDSRFDLEVDAVEEGWALLVGTRTDGR
jgi:ribosomal protein L11 methyltransferase